MHKDQVKLKGVLFNSEKGCEMYLIIGKWNAAARKQNHHWYMISEKTGVHSVTTQSNRPNEKVKAHWEGFKINQNAA